MFRFFYKKKWDKIAFKKDFFFFLQWQYQQLSLWSTAENVLIDQ